jgi:ABC-type Fe3+/spermidine/putrescine transport system ATPase subunit
MRTELRAIQQRVGITFIYITHDQGEALTMSDRIAVVSAGRLLQVGTPTEIYERPVNRFVTSFIGESNILSAEVAAVDGESTRLTFNGAELSAPTRNGVEPGRAVSLIIRPEHLLLGVEAERPGLNMMRGRIRKETYQGALIRYELEVGEATLVAESQNLPDRPIYPENTEIAVGWHPASSAILEE